jgi:hypothetical protein
MPESEPGKNAADITPEKTADHADSAGAVASASKPDAAAKKPDSDEKKPDAAAKKPAKQKRPPVSRGAKWAIVLLSLLCFALTCALLVVTVIPRLIERDVNRLLQAMAEGGGAEFRIKSISLTSAEVACKFTDTTRDGMLQNVGGIGSLSIHFSPLALLFDRTIESIDIENCDVTADYSDDSISIPAYNIFARSLQSRKKKEKGDSAPIDDLNAAIPAKVGRISLSGSLSVEAQNEDALDILHIPYAITLRPDPELGWNKLECSWEVYFAMNNFLGQAVYLHREKKIVLDLNSFTIITAGLPGIVRSALPRGFHAGISMSAKAEIDLNSLTVSEVENSSCEVDGDFWLTYRTREGLRIDSHAEFTLKTVPRIIPTVKPMTPPKTEKIFVFTLGALKGEYDGIPFELAGTEASVSFRHRTLQGGFQLTVADSEPAKFSFGGNMDEDGAAGLSLNLDNAPLLKASYKGVDISLRPGKLAAMLADVDGALVASADFACAEIRAGLDGAGLNHELKGLSVFLRPESFSAHFELNDGHVGASAELAGGESGAGFKNMTVGFNPGTIRAEYDIDDGDTNISVGLTGGELLADVNGIKVSFLPETLSADFVTFGDFRDLTARLLGGKLNVELNGMACEAESVSFGAESNLKTCRGDAKIGGFRFRQLAAGLTYDAPELGMNAAYDDGMLSGTVSCPDSRLAMPELKLLAQNLSWDFPFDYALAEAVEDAEEADENEDTDEDAEEADEVGDKDEEDDDVDTDEAEPVPAAAPRTGKISLGDFEFNGAQAASLDGTIQWDDAAKTFRLKSDAHLFSINGQIYANIVLGDAGVETECGLVIPEQQADLSKDLARFLPQFEEISCTGKLSADAVYRILPKTTTGHAEFHIADADVLIPEQKLEVRGIGLGFEIPEIAVLKSAPGQTLTFKSVKYGNIETGAGRATFRMEAPNTWQVENAVLDWCNGHIRLGGITYRAGQTTTEAVLYCDRLELPLFLTQIGLGQINGSGSINGTIPVVLVQKTDAFGKAKIDNIYFEDAFLFSTPGEDGLIKGEIDEALMDASTGIEMELSRDALKDFTYSWVRMRMLSTGPDKENLKLELQLDGHPNRALYYAFDENTASFVRSPTPCIFQGIRLDTNVNMYGKAMELVDYFQQIFSRKE